MSDALMALMTTDADAAMQALYDAHGAEMTAYAAAIVHDWQTAEDVVQSVLLTVWSHRDRYIPGTFRGWLYTMLRNRCRDDIRRRPRYAELAVEPPQRDLDDEERFLAECQRAADDVLRAEVRRMVDSLPAAQASTMRDLLDGDTVEGVASRRGVRWGTVAKQRTRAMANLTRMEE